MVPTRLINATTAKRPPILPGFVLGFIGMAAVRSAVDYYLSTSKYTTAQYNDMWKQIVSFTTDTLGTKFFLGMAMSGVGLNTRLSVLSGVGWKPFFVGGVGASVALATGYACIEGLDAWMKNRNVKTM